MRNGFAEKKETFMAIKKQNFSKSKKISLLTRNATYAHANFWLGYTAHTVPGSFMQFLHAGKNYVVKAGI